jgi:hypothetical protein
LSHQRPKDGFEEDVMPDAFKKRVEELLGSAQVKRESLEGCFEMYTGALGVPSAVDRHDRTAGRAVKIPGEVGSGENSGRLYRQFSSTVIHTAIDALENLRVELALGLIRNLRLQMTGRVLADRIHLARTTLREPGDAAKNVASVLAAAGFEDVIRKLGSTFAGSMGGDTLAEVLIILKQKAVLTGPQFTTAQGYLTFRDTALHAEWNGIDRPTVSSVLAFIEELILRYFE